MENTNIAAITRYGLSFLVLYYMVQEACNYSLGIIPGPNSVLTESAVGVIPYGISTGHPT